MTDLSIWLSSIVRSDEEGQGLAEYALILSLIAVVAITAIGLLGGQFGFLLGQSANAV